MEYLGVMKMAKISVIVPVYRVEQYIEKCVNSILSQTLADIEVILVDDGSLDNCVKICDNFANKDSRVKVLHKKNEGLSAARNTGLTLAESEYISFVDSDDYLAEDMLELLYNNIIKYSADISICGLYDCYEDKKIPQYAKNELLVVDNKEALRLALEGEKFSVNAVNKLYKKNLFDKISFPEGKLSEDAFTIPKILAKAEKIVFDSSPKYYYVHRGQSITTSNFKRNDFDVVEAYSEILEFVKENFKDLTKQAEFRLLWSYTYVFDKMILSKDFRITDDYKKTLGILRANTLKMLRNQFFSLKRKIAMLILYVSPSLYRVLLKYQKNKFMKLNY